MAVNDKPEKLDEATDLALAWAIDTLNLQVPQTDETFLKIQQLKAQAAAIVAGLKVRTDPAAMRGQKEDRVGALLAKRLRVSNE